MNRKPSDQLSARDQVQKSATVFYVTAIIIGLGAGYAVHAAISSSPLLGAKSNDWQASAKANGWIAKGDCTGAVPAEPERMVLNILDPPSNSNLHFANRTLKESITLSVSRPLENGEAIGLVYAEEVGQATFAVVWPDYRPDNPGTVRFDTPDFPFSQDKPLRVNIWAFVTQTRDRRSATYANPADVRNATGYFARSSNITVNVGPI
jgi:hypothetical protein